MGRGLFFGVFWGLIVGALVLAVASLLGEVPERDAVQTSTRDAPAAGVLDVPAGSEFDTAREDVPVDAPSGEMPVDVARDDAPLVAEPANPLTPAQTLASDVTQSMQAPQTGAVTVLGTPPEGADSSGVTLSMRSPLESGLEEGAPDAPAAPQPEDAAQAGETAPALVVPQADANAAPATAASPLVDLDTALTRVPPSPDAPASPSARTAPSAGLATAPREPVLPPAVDPEPAAPSVAARISNETAAQDAMPTVTTGGFGNRTEGIVVNRPGRDTAAPFQPEAVEAAEEQDPRAIKRFASESRWSGEDDRPLFSLVLIDEDADASRLPALANFDGPLTFAVPADADGAREAMAAYRAAGHEVVILADLPAAISPADVEVAMASYFLAVPEAVAVLDGSLAGFRGNRRTVEQVVEILNETGHGLLMFDQGLNTASRIARQGDVPVDTIYRDLDGKGQNNTIIRRFLDQAAFRAGQEGEAVLLARMRAETISALLIWHQQERARRVNLAPLSAVLLSEPDV